LDDFSLAQRIKREEEGGWGREMERERGREGKWNHTLSSSFPP